MADLSDLDAARALLNTPVPSDNTPPKVVPKNTGPISSVFGDTVGPVQTGVESFFNGVSGETLDPLAAGMAAGTAYVKDRMHAGPNSTPPSISDEFKWAMAAARARRGEITASNPTVATAGDLGGKLYSAIRLLPNAVGAAPTLLKGGATWLGDVAASRGIPSLMAQQFGQNAVSEYAGSPTSTAADAGWSGLTGAALTGIVPGTYNVLKSGWKNGVGYLENLNTSIQAAKDSGGLSGAAAAAATPILNHPLGTLGGIVGAMSEPGDYLDKMKSAVMGYAEGEMAKWAGKKVLPYAVKAAKAAGDAMPPGADQAIKNQAKGSGATYGAIIQEGKTAKENADFNESLNQARALLATPAQYDEAGNRVN